MFWRRINLLENIDKSGAKFQEAKRAAESHGGGILPILQPTEQEVAWVLLFGHIKKEQIRPQDIKRFKRKDLEYLAGMINAPPELSEAEQAKLRENVARARTELDKRNRNRSAILSAVIGAIVATLVSFILQLL